MDVLIKDLLEVSDCAVFYYESQESIDLNELYFDNLRQFQLIVFPVTQRMLESDCRALKTDLPFALEHNINILPVLVEERLIDPYTAVFGSLQFLDKTSRDETALSYKNKLTAFMNMFGADEEKLRRIRESFDSYIFLSYRKIDRRYAQELMRLIHEVDEFSDVAIWYDEYLTPGEDYSELIKKMLQHSPVFAMAVTPNLLVTGNYVMEHEYPAALKDKKSILAAKLKETDWEQLQSCYHNIPDATDPRDFNELHMALTESFKNIPLGSNKNNPQHLYYMGLAYLNGVDVEVDSARAVKYIEKAALSNNEEAAQKMAEMYEHGQGVPRDGLKSLVWRYLLFCIQSRKLKKIGFFEYDKKLVAVPLEKRELFCRYVENLHCIANNRDFYNGKLISWCDSEIEACYRLFSSTYDTQILRCLIKACICVLKFNYNFRSVSSSDIIDKINELYREDKREEYRTWLMQTRAIAANSLFYDDNVRRRNLEEFVRLCKKELEKSYDIELMGCLAQNLYNLSKFTSGSEEVHYLREAVDVCLRLLENNCDYRITILLANIYVSLFPDCTPGDIPGIQQTANFMERICLKRVNHTDLSMWKFLMIILSSLYMECKDEEKSRLYQEKADSIYIPPYTTEPENNSEILEKKVLSYALDLNKLAEKYNCEENFLSEDIVDLSKILKIRHPDFKCVQVLWHELRILQSGLQKNNYKELFDFDEKVKQCWKDYALSGISEVRLKIIDEIFSAQGELSPCDYSACTDAVRTVCEEFGFVWRLNTYSENKQSIPDIKMLLKPFTDRAKIVFDVWSKLLLPEAVADNKIANNCLLALCALVESDAQKAKGIFKTVLETACDASEKSATLIAFAHEVLAMLSNEDPASATEHFKKANEYRQRETYTVQRMIIALNNCDMARLSLKLDEDNELINYLDAAMFFCSWDIKTEYQMRVSLIVADESYDILKNIAPISAKKRFRDAQLQLNNYLRYHDNEELAALKDISAIESKYTDLGKGAVIKDSSNPEDIAIINDINAFESFEIGDYKKAQDLWIEVIAYLKKKPNKLEYRRYCYSIADRFLCNGRSKEAACFVDNIFSYHREQCSQNIKHCQHQYRQDIVGLIRSCESMTDRQVLETLGVYIKEFEKYILLIEKDSDVKNKCDALDYYFLMLGEERFFVAKFYFANYKKLYGKYNKPIKSAVEVYWYFFVKMIRSLFGRKSDDSRSSYENLIK